MVSSRGKFFYLFNLKTFRLKWPIGNVDKRNERIQATLRPYHMVIRDELFYNFIYKIFRIDPEERLNASELLNDPFFKVKTPVSNQQNKYMYSHYTNSKF